MTQQYFKWRAQGLRVTVIAASLALASCLPVVAQDRHEDRRNSKFYQGARDGGRGGDYNGRDRQDRGDNYNRDYNNRSYDNRGYSQGGIGPGKGAAIGAVGGAVLGAIFGGGMRGVIVGGAAGAGIGAIAGEAHRNNQRRQYYGGRPY
jgi:hypothetical protein